jgi:hypothetical protein
MFKPSQRFENAFVVAFQVYEEELRESIRQELYRKIGASKPSKLSTGETKALRSPPKKKRRKAPIQLCPVPRCSERAAPVFGMVCAKHKDVAKSKIKKYRADRAKKK